MNQQKNKHDNAMPESWDASIHALFLQDKINDAIAILVKKLNDTSSDKPKGLFEQLSCYLFLIKDYKGSSSILKKAHDLYPNDKNLLNNLGVSLLISQSYQEAIHYVSKHLKKNPKDFNGWDSLASAYFRMGNQEKATKAGKNALLLKDREYGSLSPNDTWMLPEQSIKTLTSNKKKVIAFSLWGNEKRYIFGALRNLLLAPDLYPEWELWFYVDNTVSKGFLDLIKELGGKVMLQADNQSLREKLCWRFAVANEPSIGYFLVRDADSVFSFRESLAVQEWIKSNKHFHIIRDWWTHTELILAGMWGGIGGILPNIKTLLDSYSPDAVTAPNIDQWFLRDCLWRYIKKSYLAHDRCYSYGVSRLIPGPLPSGNQHIGACEYHQRPEFQEKILAAWLDRGKKKAENSPISLP